ncbi:MAG: DUF4922 domain-containing protein [Firmicutes bacterium]|nr:DUF4922 domain-containing protein [Bacillota bacterium]MCM1402099.1 DUF4922 domain-containing protein [Bacteroides sp.]MCM1477970.1 DUF4922 domain-containing protein [Bacteroides sp.]
MKPSDTMPIGYTDFIKHQLEAWPLARKNYEALGRIELHRLTVDGCPVSVQHNPERIRSSAANLNPEAIKSRPCFLCRSNRPAEQLAIDAGDYEILVNPYPVFPTHLTIAAKAHTPQAIAGRMGQMLELAARLESLTVFYNGARSGASAPDHFHFQAVPSEALPIWQMIDSGKGWPLTGVELFEGEDPAKVSQLTEGYLWGLNPGEEPDVNIYARYREGRWQTAVIARRNHRPANYGAEPGQILISPAAVEMAGVIVAPRPQDAAYCKEAANIKAIFAHCGSPRRKGMTERKLDVGIVRAVRIDVTLNGEYLLNGSPAKSKNYTVELTPDRSMTCNGETTERFTLKPLKADSSFTLSNVTIGIGFHWEQHEDQSFHGELRIVADGDSLQAINRVGVETYLRSVVSSEMNAQAPLEFLKAHAVISRSWVLAQVMPPSHLKPQQGVDTDTELVKWYDRESHTGFDICADDHCQRYQGCTKASTPTVEEALKATAGEVLAYGNELCDARFYKCCGGVTELFSTCWQPVDLPYIQALDDPFCGRATAPLLRRVLNNYDQSTSGYYCWHVSYTAEELAEIVKERSGMDFGRIVSLTPLHRGPSGRIDRLRIEGTKRTRIIGKELEIRRTLSRSHLYSSAFVAEALDRDSEGIPGRWELHGRGWGHGAGLCQIGAAQMAAEGYDYKQILAFYFPQSRLITYTTSND